MIYRTTLTVTVVLGSKDRRNGLAVLVRVSDLLAEQIGDVRVLGVAEYGELDLCRIVAYRVAAHAKLSALNVYRRENGARGFKAEKRARRGKSTLVRACAHRREVVHRLHSLFLSLCGEGGEKSYRERNVVNASLRVRIGACGSVDERGLHHGVSVSRDSPEAVLRVGHDGGSVRCALGVCRNVRKSGTVSLACVSHDLTAGDVVREAARLFRRREFV